MLAEMIQRGAVETQAKYYVESGATEAVSERAWQRFRKLKQPAARQRHFVECQRLETISKELGQRHGEAIWVRAFVFDVRPLLPDAAIKSAKTKQRKKKSTTKKTHRYRRRRYPRWSR